MSPKRIVLYSPLQVATASLFAGWVLPQPAVRIRSRSLLWSELMLGSALALGLATCTTGAARDVERPPNVIIVLADDLGYGDLPAYGGTDIATPTLDRMAREGVRLTSFYSYPTCTAARAALMTGCFPKRIGLDVGSRFTVLLHADEKGLAPSEVTIAEVLRERGYATACVGKWHLGDQPVFLPTRQGFDEFFGLPYSHDIEPGNPRAAERGYPALPLLDGETVVELGPSPDGLTRRFTERALAFIERNAERPFFLFLSHAMPHQPVGADPAAWRDLDAETRAAIEAGDYAARDALYGLAIEELDASLGLILAKLEELGLDDDTLVLFLSDNGPQLRVGSAGPLRGGKGSALEGGSRVPFLARWPGHLEAGAVRDEVVRIEDVLATVAARAGAPRPRGIDGRDAWPILSGGAAEAPRVHFFWVKGRIAAIRRGPWKLYTTGELFDVEADPGEGSDVAADNRDAVRGLMRYIDAARAAFGDHESLGPACRPAGRVVDPRPLELGAPAPERPPNVVLVFTDDQGYGDVGCFGSRTISTPHLDRMAAEGIRLTSFYAQAVCGPSRAALMTGSYPIRVGEPGNRKHEHTVLHEREVTIAEVLKGAGYATACIGKWHLAGARRADGSWDARLMPNAQGFDEFFGTPEYNGITAYVDEHPFRSPLMRNGEVIVPEVEDWSDITRRYTDEALRFLRAHQEEPFFLYLAHTMPHVPLGTSPDFRSNPAGPYANAIEEIDWSVGRILAELEALGLDDETLVIFTSDNGPWIETTEGNDPKARAFLPRDHSGDAGPLRGYKMVTWEGGLRVPFIARWPGRIPAGAVSDEVVATIDLFPTFARLARAPMPFGWTLDGRDVWPILAGAEDATSPHEAFYYYSFTHLQAVRSGRWKLVVPRPEFPRWTGFSARFIGDDVATTELYDLDADPGETHDVAAEHPDVVARLDALIETGREELGDYDRIGTGARFFEGGERRPHLWRGPLTGRPQPPSGR